MADSDVALGEAKGAPDHLHRGFETMGHKDLKTTMRHIRAVQAQRNVRSQNFGHKLATQAERPPMLAAVSS